MTTETLNTNTPYRRALPAGNVFSIDASAGTGHTGQMAHSGAQPTTMKAVQAGTTLRVGPYPVTTHHYFGCLSGTLALTELAAVPPLPVSGAPADTVEMFGATAPVDYTDGTPPATGEGVAGPGSRYTDTATGFIYTNVGTKAAPAWQLVGLPISGAPTDIREFFGAGAPVDYTDGTPPATGEGVAGIGSRYTNTTTGTLYTNTGTKAQPAWTQLAPAA